MSSVIKSYTSIIFIIIAFVVSIGVISMSVDIQNARNFYSTAVTEIENSDANDKVIEALQNDAKKNKYKLTVTKTTGGTTKVVLEYKYSFKFLNISNNQKIEGYARWGGKTMRLIIEEYGLAVVFTIFIGGLIGLLYKLVTQL